ncbi:MAG: branched-chain amino acid aminotransferase [Christensenellales bacterium]|jgi:branched-chain amino acid aminotransferase
MQKIEIRKAETLKPLFEDASKLTFGHLFTDHMFTMRYNPEKGWHAPVIEPYRPLELDPSAMVFHYGQTIFEGLKAYRAEDGRALLFRPADNFARMNRSAERMCIPRFDEELAMAGLIELLRLEERWIPTAPGTSLYIRPTIIATDPYLGVRASNTYLFFIILSPVGPYYAEGFKPVRIYVEDEYVRAVRGGTGFTKAAANYAISLLAGEVAKEKGYSQVLWLDGVHRRYVEEVGSMNICFKIGGKIVTPALNGSILPGITRDSVLRLSADMGYPVEERLVEVEELFAAHEQGTLEEVFGTGTAAVVSPVGELRWKDRSVTVGDGQTGPVALALYERLTGIQYGKLPDPYGWSVEIR